MSGLQDTHNRRIAQNTASLTGMGIDASADDDQIAAMRRLIGDLHVPIERAKYKYAALLKHLAASELTINFEAHKFFNKKPKNEKYVAQWEGGQTWGDPVYMNMRDEAEEAMFDYSGTRAFAKPEARTVQRRVELAGKRDEPLFEGAVRPKYGALNFARLKYGSAGQWGKSYMVVKEYIKHNATYVHTDSFDLAGSARQRATLAGQLANFMNLQRLLVNMSTGMLTALDQASRGVSFGEATQVPGLSQTNYIEVHVHSEIRFDRDIAKLVINRNEVLECVSKLTHLAANEPGKNWKVRSSEKLTKIFEKFATTYGIEIEYA